MKAILCKIIKVESLHPDYKVITDYDSGAEQPIDISIPGSREDFKYQNDLWRYNMEKEIDSKSFCAPGFIKEGEPVLRFDWLPNQYLKKYNFDRFSLFGDIKTQEELNDELITIGGNRCPKRSQVIPTNLIWGEAQHIRCLQTRNFVPTNMFGYDYSEALGFSRFQPPGEIDSWQDTYGEWHFENNRIL